MLPRRYFYALVACATLSGVGRAAPAEVELPTGGKIKKVDFERHIMGLLSKAGCNSGSCHGSFQGKNGFRLSLFGYEPAMDFANLTRDNLGRRINTLKPDESLLLTKATGATAHEGGMRFGKDGWVYNTFRQWMSDGARWEKGSGAIEKLEISPPDFALLADAKPKQIGVTATFADGTREDITPFCDFRISDDAIAAVSPFGLLTPRQPGDAGLTVLYRGSVKAIRVLVPAPVRPGAYPQVPETNVVDTEVFAKLKMMNVVPSDLASDETFLRRVFIDTVAQLPPPETVREFVADKDPHKREKLIDKLLAHPLHAAVWATKLSDVTGNNTQALEQPAAAQPKRSQMWHDWLRKRVADNVPYDRIVRDILTATSLDGGTAEEWLEATKKIEEQSAKSGFKTDYPEKKTLDLFWRRQQGVPIEQWGEKVAAAFLGVRLECAQCHKHPTDRWTQDEYWAFANVFAQVTFANNQYSTPDVKKVADAENAERRSKLPAGGNANNIQLVRELFVTANAGRARPNPATNKVPVAKTLGGPEVRVKPGEDARAKLAAWVTAPDNPFFARSFVNRAWAHYFGVGLVNPVDDFSLANPPTNARLLDALASDFVTGGYDVRKLERTILMSRTYQLSYAPNETNKFDKNNFSHAYARPLMAEQVVDVLNSALGVEERFTGQDEAPAGTKMVEVGSSRLNGNVAYALRIFGRPPRTTACDCERAMEPALPQTLFRMTDATVLVKFTDPTGRVQKLAKTKLADAELVEEAFLATLSRLPTEKQKADGIEHLRSAKNRTEGVTGLLWALVNTREFILNH